MIKKITNIKGNPVEFSLSGISYTRAVFDLPAVLKKMEDSPDGIIRMDDAVYKVAERIDGGYHVICDRIAS